MNAVLPTARTTTVVLAVTEPTGWWVGLAGPFTKEDADTFAAAVGNEEPYLVGPTGEPVQQMLHGTRGSVPTMTRNLLVHPEHTNTRPTRITGLY